MDIGAPEILVIVIAMLLLFGYKRLPDASRSIGRSLRIFKSEMKGMQADEPAEKSNPTPVSGEVLPAAAQGNQQSSRLEADAQGAEARAAELRARAEQARSGSASGVR